MDSKVAIVTGANGAMGYSLCERLLGRDPTLRLLLIVQFVAQGRETLRKLERKYSGRDIDFLACDLSSTTSVYATAAKILKRYSSIDYLYLNAGVMVNAEVNLWKMAYSFFTLNFVAMFETGNCLDEFPEGATSEGLQETFATNVFGHYLLMKEVSGALGRGAGQSRVIWTGSSNAHHKHFSLKDIQAAHGAKPYSSSKYLVEVVSCETDRLLKEKGVRSHVACPGMVQSEMTEKLMSPWMWLLLTPVICFLRLLVSSFTLVPEHGSFILDWLTTQNPVDLDPATRYGSGVNFLGHNYVLTHKLNQDPEEGEAVLKQLEDLDRSFRTKERLSALA